MTAEYTRGTVDNCLAQGARAARLLQRFRAVVPAQEMPLVFHWFDQLQSAAELYLPLGHELVSVGIDHRNADARPFMVFNPTRWQGARRELVAPTSQNNPRNWVSIQA